MDSETEQRGATLNEENINSPWKLLRESIINVKHQKQLIILKGNRRGYKLKQGQYLQQQKY